MTAGAAAADHAEPVAGEGEQYLPHLNKAMAEADINTPRRQAAFLAQLAHESGEFRYMEEIASGAAYEGRRDLGNTQPGDGVRFKGRGPIQLTGPRQLPGGGQGAGHRPGEQPQARRGPGRGLPHRGLVLEQPQPEHATRTRATSAITRRINGGYNGVASREVYYRRALDVLG